MRSTNVTSPKGETTLQPNAQSRNGYFPIPNDLLVTGCRRPVALAVYAALAGTPAIWNARGDLSPFEVSTSLSWLMDATASTRKQVRGAVAWLIRGGFLTLCRPAQGRRAAVYALAHGAQRAQNGQAVSDDTPTGSTISNGGQGHTTASKGTKEGTKRAQSKPLPDNGLPDSPQPSRAQNGAQVLKDFKTKTTTPPPQSPPPPEGDCCTMVRGVRRQAAKRTTGNS